MTQLASSVAAEPGKQVFTTAGANGSSNEAFVVFGKVTGPDGEPMERVEVIAHCGNGTLLPTGKAVTGANGEYRLSFGPGLRMGRTFRGVGDLGVGFQAATISAHKAGYFAQDLGRAGNLAMTDYTNIAPGRSTNFVGVVRPFVPYRLNFQLQPASRLQGDLEDPSHQLPPKTPLCLKGQKLPPSSSVLACVDLSDTGHFEFPNVPVGFAFWFEVTWRENDQWKTLRSKPLTPSSPKNLKIVVRDDALQVTEIP